MRHKCTVCKRRASIICEGCLSTWYCSQAHLTEDKPAHTPNCYPVIEKSSEKYGRCLITTKKINAGDIIIIEKPLVVFPMGIDETLCLSCASTINSDYKCPDCAMPMCNEACTSKDIHIPECVVLSQPIKKFKGSSPFMTTYNHIGMLRCLFSQNGEDMKWKRLQNMDTPKPAIGALNLLEESMFLKEHYNLSPYSLKDVKHALTTVSLSSYIITGRGKKGLYERVRMIPHRCFANAFYSFNRDENIVIKAAVDIPIGAEITINSFCIRKGYFDRQDYMKCFASYECDCIRCTDATDVGTHLSSLTCVTCETGLIVPPLKPQTKWECNSCGIEESLYDVKCTKVILGKMLRELTTLADYEDFLKHSIMLLSENHYIRLEAKADLLFLFHRQEIEKPTIASCRNRMRRKFELCKDITIFDRTVTGKGYCTTSGAIQGIYMATLYQELQIAGLTGTQAKCWKVLKKLNAVIHDVLIIYLEDSSASFERSMVHNTKATELIIKAYLVLNPLPDGK